MGKKSREDEPVKENLKGYFVEKKHCRTTASHNRV